ncbi:hypothetical protein [Bacillus mojavensis]|uniref:response regulator aspartate phosphatase n=1 Tax=Bacillus mojavensis TaxID=72360 RepID=UPI002DBBBC2D|nr:hypothetical protein [Bacillus mojavensis]
MSVPDLIPYHFVTTDINHWYVVIKQGRIEKAKGMKRKVENLIRWRKTRRLQFTFSS